MKNFKPILTAMSLCMALAAAAAPVHRHFEPDQTEEPAHECEIALAGGVCRSRAVCPQEQCDQRLCQQFYANADQNGTRQHHLVGCVVALYHTLLLFCTKILCRIRGQGIAERCHRHNANGLYTHRRRESGKCL